MLNLKHFIQFQVIFVNKLIVFVYCINYQPNRRRGRYNSIVVILIFDYSVVKYTYLTHITFISEVSNCLCIVEKKSNHVPIIVCNILS